MSKTILIIEDEVDLSELWQQQLRKNGYKVQVINDWTQLELSQLAGYSLIIGDLYTPEMTAMSWAESIQNKLSTISCPPLVLTSGQVIHQSIWDDFASKYPKTSGVLIKPFRKEVLLNAITKFAAGNSVT